jgi:hypothetical protein
VRINLRIGDVCFEFDDDNENKGLKRLDPSVEKSKLAHRDEHPVDCRLLSKAPEKSQLRKVKKQNEGWSLPEASMEHVLLLPDTVGSR